MKGLLWGFITLVWVSLSFAQETKVYYLAPAEEQETIKQYNLKLLQLALEKTADRYGAYQVIDVDSSLTQQEALKHLRESNRMEVVPTMTDRLRESVFLSVKVPLYKGVFGIRMLMLNEADKDRLAGATSASSLREFTFGQGFDWPDTQILEKNGFSVKPYSAKSEMFGALSVGEFDFFPRSVVEIWDELEQNKSYNFSIHPDAYIYYPTAILFFMKRDKLNLPLVKRIEEGLNLAIDDGSFDKLFNTLFADFIAKGQLNNKEAIKLVNPLLPQSTPVNTPKYWYVE